MQVVEGWRVEGWKEEGQKVEGHETLSYHQDHFPVPSTRVKGQMINDTRINIMKLTNLEVNPSFSSNSLGKRAGKQPSSCTPPW